jgi:hypothetical protein
MGSGTDRARLFENDQQRFAVHVFEPRVLAVETGMEREGTAVANRIAAEQDSVEQKLLSGLVQST